MLSAWSRNPPAFLARAEETRRLLEAFREEYEGQDDEGSRQALADLAGILPFWDALVASLPPVGSP